MTDSPHVYRRMADETSVFYTWFSAMHTRVDILISSNKTEEQLIAVSSNIRQLIADIELTANCFDEKSELARANRLAYSQPFNLSPRLEDLLESCFLYNKQTEGLFDVTTDSKNYSCETSRHISIQNHQLSYIHSGIRVNLSGFLKGYALDQVKDLLKRQGISDGIVSIGNSSVMAIGNQQNDDGWTVSLQESRRKIILHNQCLTTSGNDSGTRQHIIHPHTGQFIEGRRSVAVVTGNGTEGEVLSTSLFIGSSAQRQRLLSRFLVYDVIDL